MHASVAAGMTDIAAENAGILGKIFCVFFDESAADEKGPNEIIGK